MRKRTGVVFLLFVLMFGVSSESHAFLEWLHKLSGPGPFWGLRAEFRFDCTAGCKFLESNLPIEVPRRLKDVAEPTAQDQEGELPANSEGWPAWTVSIAPGWAESVANDLNYGRDVKGPDVTILSLEPAVQFWFKGNEWYVGLGYALNTFKGEGFEDFSRNSAVIRGVKRCEFSGKGIRRLELGVKYLLFSKHFRPADFGALGNDREDRGVWGASLVASF